LGKLADRGRVAVYLVKKICEKEVVKSQGTDEKPVARTTQEGGKTKTERSLRVLKG